MLANFVSLFLLLFIVVVDQVHRLEVWAFVEVVHAIQDLADVGETCEYEETNQVLDSWDIAWKIICLLHQLHSHLSAQAPEVIRLDKALYDAVGFTKQAGEIILAHYYQYPISKVRQWAGEDKYFECEGEGGCPLVADKGGAEVAQEAKVIENEQEKV